MNSNFTNMHHSFVEHVNNLAFENFKISEAMLEFENLDCHDESHVDLLTFPLPDDAPWLCPSIKAAIGLAKMLIDCLKASAVSSDMIYVEDNQLNKVKTIAALTLSAMKKEFAHDQYSKLLCSEEKLPLEVLCYLQLKEIMPIQMYLQCNVTKSHVIGQFSKSVVHMFTSPQLNKDVERWMSKEIMFCLVNCMFTRSLSDSGNDQSAIRKVCHAMVDSVINNVIISSVTDVNITLNERLNIVAVMMEDTRINASVLSSFCSYLQKTVLTSNPTVKVSQALAEQHLWLYKLSSPFFISVLQKCLSSSELSEVISLLKSLVQHQEVNWKMLLVFISTCLACYQQAAHYLSELVEGMLQQAFANLQLDSLITAFLIGRQVSLESPPIQRSYSNWFQKCFADPTIGYTNSPKNFAFLVKFLTSLVPHEQAVFLKTHILKPPHVVPRCRSLWNDYLSLAKTRLRDLKEPVEELGIYPTDGEPLQKQGELHAETDVEKAVQLFHGSGKIPSTVFEASIFRKPYFNGRFLVALLKPRLLPDVPDVKMQFIEQLKLAGKIPEPVFEDYIKKCENEALGILEGVEMYEDHFEDPLIEPSAKLKQALDFLSKQLCIADKSEVGPAISQVSSTLQFLFQNLQDFPSPVMKQDYVISLDSLDSSKNQKEEVVNELLQMFCCVLPSRANNWDVLFVSMLSCHQVLHLPLVKHLWHTFTQQEEVNEGLVLLLYRIGTIFPQVEKNGKKDSLPHMIFHVLPVSSVFERQHFLALSAKYLQFAFECETSPENISKALITKFQFAFLTDRKRMTNCIYESLYKKVQNLGPKLTFEEWLLYEKEVILEMMLYERMDTLRFWVYDYFLGDQEDELSAVGSKLLRNFLDMQVLSSSLFPLLTILQEILLHLKPNAVPFLLEYFDEKILPTDGSNPIIIQSQLETFFRLVTCLSPHLLFTNHPSHVSEESLVRVSHILQHFAREYVTEGQFLTKTLTLHVWQGLLQLNTRPELIGHFLKETPVLRAATIMHYKSLCKQCSITPYFNLLQRLFNKLEKMECSVPSELEAWEAGLALSLQLPVIIPSSSTEVEAYILLFALIHSDEGFNDLNSISQQAFNKLISLIKAASLQAREKCCRPQFYQQLSTQIQRFLSTNCWQLYPPRLLHLMLRMWEEGQVSDTWWMNAILENYKECKIQLAVDVESLVAIGARMKSILHSCPSYILKSISKELWEEYDFTTQLNLLQT